MCKVEIEKLNEPVGVTYSYNAKIFTSVDNGNTFHYCGNGKYFQTLKQAEEFKKEIETNWIKEGTFPPFLFLVLYINIWTCVHVFIYCNNCTLTTL